MLQIRLPLRQVLVCTSFPSVLSAGSQTPEGFGCFASHPATTCLDRHWNLQKCLCLDTALVQWSLKLCLLERWRFSLFELDLSLHRFSNWAHSATMNLWMNLNRSSQTPSSAVVCPVFQWGVNQTPQNTRPSWCKKRIPAECWRRRGQIQPSGKVAWNGDEFQLLMSKLGQDTGALKSSFNEVGKVGCYRPGNSPPNSK